MINGESNRIRIVGTVESVEFSHCSHGVDLYQVFVSVKRKTKDRKVFDVLPVMSKVDCSELINHKIEIVGQIRTRNIYTGNTMRLLVNIFPQEMYPVDDSTEDANDVYLDGYICRKPTYRATPFNKHISDICFAVRRNGASDYVPCIAWDKQALRMAVSDVGDHFELLGKLRSRKYEKHSNDMIEYRTAYEVSIHKMKFVEGKNDEIEEVEMSEF